MNVGSWAHSKGFVALEMEPAGSLNSLVDYGGLGDSDIEDSDEEVTEEEVTAIVARSRVPVTKPLVKTSKQCMSRNLSWKRCCAVWGKRRRNVWDFYLLQIKNLKKSRSGPLGI